MILVTLNQRWMLKKYKNLGKTYKSEKVTRLIDKAAFVFLKLRHLIY